MQGFVKFMPDNGFIFIFVQKNKILAVNTEKPCC